jgi:hypothetical protein
VDGVIAFLDPDVRFDMSKFEGWPEDQVYFGHAGARRFLTDWLGEWEAWEARVEELVQLDDERVFTMTWQRGSGTGSHVPVSLELATVTTVRDGLVVRNEVWSDRAAARAAAGAASA